MSKETGTATYSSGKPGTVGMSRNCGAIGEALLHFPPTQERESTKIRKRLGSIDTQAHRSGCSTYECWKLPWSHPCTVCEGGARRRKGVKRKVKPHHTPQKGRAKSSISLLRTQQTAGFQVPQKELPTAVKERTILRGGDGCHHDGIFHSSFPCDREEWGWGVSDVLTQNASMGEHWGVWENMKCMWRANRSLFQRQVEILGRGGGGWTDPPESPPPGPHTT